MLHHNRFGQDSLSSDVRHVRPSLATARGDLAHSFPPPPSYSAHCLPVGANDSGCLANPLRARLCEYAFLSSDDLGALDQLYRNPRSYPVERILVHEQSRPDCAFFLGSGVAYRYKMLDEGRRQILGYMVPGDLFDLNFLMVGRSDHNIALLTDAQVYSVSISRLQTMVADYPRIARALSLASVVDTSILREWLVNLGQRNAIQRLSHFFVEMSVRLEAVGRIHIDGSFDFPFSQMTLADTTGMTSVHINRTLQKMRGDGLIRLWNKRLLITDRAKLAALAGFDDQYLRIAHGRG